MTDTDQDPVIESMCAEQVTIQPPDQDGMELLPSVGYLDPTDARRVLRAALEAATRDFVKEGQYTDGGLITYLHSQGCSGLCGCICNPHSNPAYYPDGERKDPRPRLWPLLRAADMETDHD